MKVAYSREALRNLRDIAAYIRSHNPTAAKTVRHAIRKSADTLGEFPALGHRQLQADIRKLVVPRFGYLIYYRVYPEQAEVRILFIRHPSRRRQHRDA
jgi:addiction module RelE/StbE family toxin